MTVQPINGFWCYELLHSSRMHGIIELPGTLDTCGIGFPDNNPRPWHPEAGLQTLQEATGAITTRLTRKHTYEGAVRLSRTIRFDPPENQRVFLDFERARYMELNLNGVTVQPVRAPSISTPYTYEVTNLITGNDKITLTVDNTYPGWPRESIVYSSAATDETQTNWNGILGYMQIRTEDQVFISHLAVYPCRDNTLDVQVELSCGIPWSGELRLTSPALKTSASMAVRISTPGTCTFRFSGLQVCDQIRRWDLEEGNLYTLIAQPGHFEAKSTLFGFRTFGVSEAARLTVNDRVFFLRSETNCAVFPETGHSPMEPESWTQILRTYQEYGVNCIRFHSHVPPEAAFTAADHLGILMQPELSNWNPHTAFEDDTGFKYYQDELIETLRMLSNHPSFVMLTLGNELCAGELGHLRMNTLLRLAREKDPTRLYSSASNCEYGQNGPDAESDFYTAQNYTSYMLRATSAGFHGHLNNKKPDTITNYEEGVQAFLARFHIPLFTFEVGQYEVLPDFHEINMFHGVTSPDNYICIRNRVYELGFDSQWTKRVEASGELARLCYQAEVEAVLRTPSLSGISLLGLQDFPGQGTALIGMMGAHLKPKPYAFADPERFRNFFTDVLPMAYLEGYTYQAGDIFRADIRIANYGRHELSGCMKCELSSERTKIMESIFPLRRVPCGQVTSIDKLEWKLPLWDSPMQCTLTLTIDQYTHSYPIWVYPRALPVRPDSIYEAAELNDHAVEVLRNGGRVFLSPPSTEEALPGSIKTQFSTDFWSVGTFPFQSGSMGQCIDESHPLFRNFPTDSFSNWQWWPMANQRAVLLPRPMKAIITEMDSYAYLRPMAKLFECKCGGGSVLFSSMGLQNLQEYPEARALLSSIYTYMDSADFQPDQSLSIAEVKKMLHTSE